MFIYTPKVMAQPDENSIVDTSDYDVLSAVPSHQENGAVLYSSENDDARSKANNYQRNENGEIASSPIPTEEEPPTPNW